MNPRHPTLMMRMVGGRVAIVMDGTVAAELAEALRDIESSALSKAEFLAVQASAELFDQAAKAADGTEIGTSAFETIHRHALAERRRVLDLDFGDLLELFELS